MSYLKGIEVGRGRKNQEVKRLAKKLAALYRKTQGVAVNRSAS